MTVWILPKVGELGEGCPRDKRAFRMEWSNERTEQGVTLFHDGASASEAAEALGVTRNAVIGKWHRLGLRRLDHPVLPRERLPPPINRARHRASLGAPARRMRGTAAPLPKMVEWGEHESALNPNDIPRMQRRSFAMLEERHCRFPYGSPGTDDFFFCGAPRAEARMAGERLPYCVDHCRVAYRPAGRPDLRRSIPALDSKILEPGDL